MTAATPTADDGCFDEAALRQRLAAAFAGVARKRVVVAVSAAGRRAYAAVGGGADAADEAEHRAVPTGCVTKLLVAALVDVELACGRLACDDDVADVLDTPYRHVLAGTTIRHLLEHTHGLDDSSLTAAPLRSGGFVDADALLTRLDGERLAAPGAFYSYSNAGAWLLAAVLERLHRRPFAVQLRERVLDALGLRERCCEPSLVPGRSICPSMGGTLALSARDLLTFLEARADAWRARAGTDRVTPLPGWNALEKGICLGWKSHGEGWLGHQSIWPGASLMVRIEPQRRIALVIASEHQPAQLVATKLFAGLLPELKHLTLPKRLPPERAAALDRGPYCGRYGCAAESWAISIDDDGAPALRLTTAAFATRLAPAADDLFFADAPGPGQLAFVQFIDNTESAFRYLWDGRRLLRRRPDPDSFALARTTTVSR